LALDADTNRLTVKGTAKLAGIAAAIDGAMDFRAGPPSQVTQHFSAAGRASVKTLIDAGLSVDDLVTAGDVGLSLTLNEHRNGDGEVLAEADLTDAVLTVAPLGWHKSVGGAAKASGRVTLANDKLTGIDRIAVDGPGLQARGVVAVTDGRLDLIRLDRLVLGRTDIKGTIGLPRDAPINAEFSGPMLDVAAKLLERSARRGAEAPERPKGPAWSLRGRFDHVLLAHDQSLSQVAVSDLNDGAVTRDLAITGRTSRGDPVAIRIEPGSGTARGTRHLAVEFADAGTMLSGLGVTEVITGGTLKLEGDFDDAARDHTLTGTLDLTEFRVARAPGLGKLLQSVTLYGLVDALSGPGLRFASLTTSFRYGDEHLEISDLRAFSPSLGLTATGQFDLAAETVSLDGTVVPAYVFNSLLGRLPLIGRLFSAEKGGGLFAMNYSLHGAIGDPAISVNPLSALTPGILRGMFGLFGQAPSTGALDRGGPTSDFAPR
jgi:hypothetical protein